jgi:hypothetical protein
MRLVVIPVAARLAWNARPSGAASAAAAPAGVGAALDVPDGLDAQATVSAIAIKDSGRMGGISEEGRGAPH